MKQKGLERPPESRWRAIPAILCMAIIFFFSAMPDEVSTMQSDYVAIHLQRLISGGMNGEGEWTDASIPSDLPVRKAAHVFEYMVFGVTLFLWMGRKRWWGGRAFLWGTLYAVSDELHQLFVPGRGCQVTDMLIDSVGVALGLLLALAFGSRIEGLWERFYQWWLVRIRAMRKKQEAADD